MSANDQKAISFFDYFYVFILIIYAGMANIHVRTFSLDKPLPAVLPLFLSLILAIRWKIVFSRRIYLLLFIYFLYFSASTIKYREIHPAFFASLFISFVVTYCTITALKFRLFAIVEELIYYLAIISLVFWGMQVILGGDNFFNIIARIPNIKTFSSVTGNGLNIVLYSVQSAFFNIYDNSILPRNCGFAWEPGGYAVYLCLAIFINRFMLKTADNRNLHFWILTLALLSTQSTTGYLIFIIIILTQVLQKNIKTIILLIPFILILLIVFLSLPFITDKITELIIEATNTEIIVEQSIGANYTTTPQRFASFVIAIRDFLNNPILGYGGHLEARWFSKLHADIAPISGLGNLLAQYGLVGFIFFIVTLYGSSVYFSKHFNYKGKFLLTVIMLFVSISYSILFVPLVMCFYLYSLFKTV